MKTGRDKDSTTFISQGTDDCVDHDSEADRATDRLMTIPEVALHLRIHRVTAYRLVERGDLQSIKIGRRRLVTPGQMKSFIDSRTTGASS